jgi:hypothetical protein
MKRLPTLVVILTTLALLVGTAQGQNLLQNGSLDDPGLHENDAIAGWTLTEGPAANTATAATFADHTSLPNGDGLGVGLWYRGFEGTTFDNPRPAVDADLTQTVPGTPGLKYALTGWALFETNWAGGLDNLPSGGTTNARWPANTPSPTRTEFALEFLNAASAVLSGSLVVDLHDDRGQANGAGWTQHMLMATAPAGTANIRVRASMAGGVNSDLNPQSAFVDDFSLVVIPEPASIVLCMIALAGSLALGRRR